MDKGLNYLTLQVVCNQLVESVRSKTSILNIRLIAEFRFIDPEVFVYKHKQNKNLSLI